MTGVSAGEGLFVCVVGPGFDTMFPAFVRIRASQAAESDGQLAPNNGIGPSSLGAKIVYTHVVQMSAEFQPRAGCVFLE